MIHLLTYLPTSYLRDPIISSRTANACYKDAADLHAQLGEFIPAIELFERVAQHSLSSALTKYSVKEYWLRSGLCALAANVSILIPTTSFLTPCHVSLCDDDVDDNDNDAH